MFLATGTDVLERFVRSARLPAGNTLDLVDDVADAQAGAVDALLGAVVKGKVDGGQTETVDNVDVDAQLLVLGMNRGSADACDKYAAMAGEADDRARRARVGLSSGRVIAMRLGGASRGSSGGGDSQSARILQ